MSHTAVVEEQSEILHTAERLWAWVIDCPKGVQLQNDKLVMDHAGRLLAIASATCHFSMCAQVANKIAHKRSSAYGQTDVLATRIDAFTDKLTKILS